MVLWIPAQNVVKDGETRSRRRPPPLAQLGRRRAGRPPAHGWSAACRRNRRWERRPASASLSSGAPAYARPAWTS